MEYFTPSELPEALALLEARSPAVIAGGTDWYPAQGEKPLRADMLDVTGIAGLRGISRDGGLWRFGAACTWSDIARADLPAAFVGLQGAAREVGALQIQNAGTIAGNLCNASPAADGVPPLLTLEASVRLASLAGERIVPLQEFIRGPRSTALRADELVVSVDVPEPKAGVQGAFGKLGARKYLVISIAMVAVTLRVEKSCIEDVGIAVGACGPVAARLSELEQALQGVPCADVTGFVQDHHLAGLSPIDDVRGSAGYRREAVRVLIERVVQEAAHG